VLLVVLIVVSRCLLIMPVKRTVKQSMPALS
jgi:hypothetical protein